MAEKLTKKLEEKLKKELVKEEEKLTKKIENLKKADPFSDPEHASDNAAVDVDVREQVGHETVQAQIQSLQRKLEGVRAAFKKMSKGGYGKCESCRKPIKLKRLKLIPEARYCMECQKRLVK